MRIKTLVLLYILSTTCTFAQRDSVAIHTPFIVLKTSPLSVFDIDNSLTIGIERSFNKNQSYQVEVGYGNSNWNLWTQFDDFIDPRNKFRDFNIFRARTEWRRYRFADIGTLPEGNYIAVEAFFKYVGKRDFYNVGREVIAGQPSYFEFMEGNKRRIVSGTHFKIGRQSFIFDDNPDKEPHFLLDFYVGLGFRIIDYRFTYDDQNPDDMAPFQNSRLFGTIDPINKTLPTVSGTLGIKLGYLLH
jgi:hypothetical protein